MFKKPFLLFSSVLLISAIMFVAFLPAFAVEGSEEQPTLMDTNDRIWLDFVDRELLREEDMNSYSWLIFVDLIDCFPRVLIPDGDDVKKVIAYPDEFAGAFIDESNRLHIVLTKPVDTETEYDYRAITGYDETVVFDVAEYPLAVLYAVQRALSDSMADFSIEFTRLNEFVNRLEVGLEDRTMEGAVVEFLKTKFDGVDAGCLIFMDATGIVPTASNTANNALAGSNNLYAGSKAAGSFGFNAYDPSTGQYGVVTAAHVATVGTQIYNSMNTLVGTATKYQYIGPVDAAFIPFPSSIQPSYYYYTSSSVAYDYFSGICKAAMYVSGLSMVTLGASSSQTDGWIQSVSADYEYDVPSPMGPIKLKFTDHLFLSFHILQGVLPGDSGGIIFHNLRGSGVPQVRLIAGIIAAGDNPIPILPANCYGVKVENIISVLNITPYTCAPPVAQYVSGIYSWSTYGYGSVNNPNGLTGRLPDGNYVQLWGGNGGDGGHIVGQLNTVTSGNIWVYAYSQTSYFTHLYTFVSNDGYSWTQTKVQTVIGNGFGPQWIDCGSSSNAFRYVALSGYNDNGNSANIFIDSVAIT